MPVTRRAWRLLAASSLPVLLLATSANAAATEAAPSAAPDTEALGEITVTAERRETKLQRTPIAISAFGSETLESRKVDSIRDLAGQIPNLRIPRATIGYTTQLFSLRGVGETDPIQEPTLSVYVDDVYSPRQIGSMLDFNDVERIEVLRGPQGTLYGRNTSAGALRVITRDPDGETRVAADLGYGSYDAVKARALLSGAILPDRLYASIAYTHYSRDGTHWNPTLGKHVNAIDVNALRAKLRWTPAERLDVQLTLDGLRDRSDTRGYTPRVQPGGGYDAFVSYSEVEPRNELDQGGASLRVKYDLDDRFALKSVTTYRGFDQPVDFENDGKAELIQKNLIHYKDKYFTQELQLNGTFDRFVFTLGAFYFHEVFDVDRDSFTRTGPLVASPVNKIGDVNSTTTDSYAIYGQGTYELTDALKLTAGLRATWEEKKFVFQSNAINDLRQVVAVRFAGRSDKSWNSLTPKIALDYTFSPTVLGYVSYTQGFKAGGFDNRAQRIEDAERAFDPEKVRSYEAGLKSELFGRHLRANLAAFYNDYSNLQVTSFVPSLNRNVRTNAASAETYGAELELSASPLEGVNIQGSAGYLVAKYRDFVGVAGAGTDASGNRLVNAPRWTLSGAVDWRLPLPVPGATRLGFDVQYSSAIYSNALNRPQDRIEGSAFVNGLLRWDAPDDHWSLSLSVKNIFENRTPQAVTYTPSNGIWYFVTGDPRTALATVRYRL
ncbi:TonB-dependent receptor [Sphingomonas oleivorans]|uniref:TonB-dependent receptor n=1 Tax=Sphingomonas oleivorans TaxID=1735121 RepID=A0A2T5FTN0_9SPHN|nr:TonB-dependent receptor [Sphingomonas oleivorans]PTQ07424.1 TonB-dependent receptor [Sphingomonas oleivorans]